ncbi:damage-specific DNA binding complex, subunit DDB1 [Terfezia claveryi]|nr:damage-specific DNA binding complex, subunit DDB1 [Terfezia claveryi]
MAYIASIHKASSVRHALKARFLGPDEDSLIVAKSNRVEIYSFTSSAEEGISSLVLGTTFTVYGQIAVLLTLHPENSPTDHLFIATEKYDYFTISWDQERKTIRNERLAKDISDRFLRNADHGAKYIADPRSRMLGLHIYQGIFTVIPLVHQPSKKGGKGAKAKALPPGESIGDMCEPSPIRLQELKVVDIVFLDAVEPTVAMLYEDGLDQINLRVYRVKSRGPRGALYRDAELEEVELGGYEAKKMDPFSKFIIPVPEDIVDPTVFSTWSKVNDTQFLLGDDYGKLYMLSFNIEKVGDKVNVDIKVKELGKISTPSRLVYLQDSYVYVGSHLGDSQLIRLDQYSDLEVVQTFSNLAPVIDFRILDMGYSGSEDHQQHLYSSGQTRIVSGSGAFHDGSLRSLRSGVSLEDLGILGEMAGIRGLWGLKTNPHSEYHDTLLVTFIDESRVFRFGPEGDVEELDSYGQFTLNEPVLTAANVSKGRLLQVTPSSATLIDSSGIAVAVWRPTGQNKINHASANEDYLLLATGGNTLVLLDLNASMSEVARRLFEQEIASLSIPAAPAKVCLMGSWTTSTVSIMALPALTTIIEENLGGIDGGAIPRSLFLGSILSGQAPTLLVAMGDGRLITYSLNEADYSLSQKKNIVLGVQPVYLQPIPAADGLVHVFATCDHPSLVYGTEGRIVYSAVTVRGAEKATFVTPFNTEAFPQSVVAASEADLRITVVDPLRTTHIQTLKVGDVVRRVSHSKQHRVFGIVTIQLRVEEALGVERYPSFVRIVDDARFDIVDSYPLDDEEFVEAILCTKLENGDGSQSEKFVVGTGFHDEGSDEPKRGRILIFELGEERRLKLACKEEVHGSCKCLEMVGGHIVAALQKTVAVYTYHYPSSPSQPVLTKLHSYRAQSEPIDISVCENIIAVGDMMKGTSLLEWDPARGKLSEVARNYQTQWLTSVALLDRETVVSADAEGNVIIQKWDTNGVTPEDRRRLSITGEVRIGEMVNRFRKVIDTHQLPEMPVLPRVYFGTVDGGIYLLGLISHTHTDLLMKLQANLARVLKGVGDLDFNRFRAFSSPERTGDEPFRFVDGDFVERFLELGEEAMREVVRPKDVTEAEWLGDGWGVEEVRGLLENLRRLH